MLLIKAIFKIPRLIITEFWGIFTNIILYYPDTSMGMYFRRIYYQYLLKCKIGIGSNIFRGVKIHNSLNNLKIGDRFTAGSNVTIISNDSFGIIIGNDVSIAHGSYIRSANHSYFSLEKPIKQQGHFAKKIILKDGKVASIIINDDVIMGAYSVILSGAVIGKGSVIAAGSVISFEIPEYSIVAGNPARVIANRKKITFSRNNIEEF